MNKEIELTVKINLEAVNRTLNVLMDNGVDPDEAGEVLKAIGFTLLDADLEPLLEQIEQ